MAWIGPVIALVASAAQQYSSASQQRKQRGMNAAQPQGGGHQGSLGMTTAQAFAPKDIDSQGIQDFAKGQSINPAGNDGQFHLFDDKSTSLFSDSAKPPGAEPIPGSLAQQAAPATPPPQPTQPMQPAAAADQPGTSASTYISLAQQAAGIAQSLAGHNSTTITQGGRPQPMNIPPPTALAMLAQRKKNPYGGY